MPKWAAERSEDGSTALFRLHYSSRFFFLRSLSQYFCKISWICGILRRFTLWTIFQTATITTRCTFPTSPARSRNRHLTVTFRAIRCFFFTHFFRAKWCPRSSTSFTDYYFFHLSLVSQWNCALCCVLHMCGFVVYNGVTFSGGASILRQLTGPFIFEFIKINLFYGQNVFMKKDASPELTHCCIAVIAYQSIPSELK